MRWFLIPAAALALLAQHCAPLEANAESRRYYVNSIYNIWKPNSWADMRRYKAFVDESKARGFDSINLDISWATARRDGAYDFSLFDKQMSYALSKGMYVWPRLNCSLISEYKPYWFTDDMYMRDISGKIHRHANGKIPSITHPVVLKEIVRFCEAVAKHCDHKFKALPSGKDPIVCMPFSFTPTLEAEYFFDGELDYSQSAKQAFKKWVRAAYPSLADLNAKWGTSYKAWDEVVLANAHPTAKELYFESRLQILLDLVGDSVHKASPRMKVGLQTGCIWDIAKRRNFNVTPLLRKMDWVLVADSYIYPHAFSVDYLRCSAPGKLVSNEIDGSGFGGGNEERLKQGVQSCIHGANAVFTSNWSLEALKDHKTWTFFEEIPKVCDKRADLKADVAIYLSPWDLINSKVSVNVYQETYNKLSENGVKVVDVIPDAVIAADPRILGKYKAVYLPANYTIPGNVRNILLTYKDKLIIQEPDNAGTLDIYGRPAGALADTSRQ
ncbi:MAG: beta-galactosidase [Armatimonadota bacterium]